MTCELFRFPPCDCFFFPALPIIAVCYARNELLGSSNASAPGGAAPALWVCRSWGGLQSSFNIPGPHCSQCDVLRTGAEHSCFLFPLTPLCCGFGLLPTGQIKTPLRGFAFLSHPCILQNRDLFNTDDALSYGMLGLDLPGLPAPHPTAPC